MGYDHLATPPKRRREPSPPPAAPAGRPAEHYVLAGAFFLYFLTAAPSVAGGDSGELLAEACHLGIARRAEILTPLRPVRKRERRPSSNAARNGLRLFRSAYSRGRR